MIGIDQPGDAIVVCYALVGRKTQMQMKYHISSDTLIYLIVRTKRPGFLHLDSCILNLKQPPLKPLWQNQLPWRQVRDGKHNFCPEKENGRYVPLGVRSKLGFMHEICFSRISCA